MLLLPTVLALRNSYIYICLLNHRNVASYIEVSIYEAISLAFALNIPDVQPDNGHVQFRRYLDNFWPGDSSNIVEDVIVLDN